MKTGWTQEAKVRKPHRWRPDSEIPRVEVNGARCHRSSPPRTLAVSFCDASNDCGERCDKAPSSPPSACASSGPPEWRYLLLNPRKRICRPHGVRPPAITWAAACLLPPELLAHSARKMPPSVRPPVRHPPLLYSATIGWVAPDNLYPERALKGLHPKARGRESASVPWGDGFRDRFLPQRGCINGRACP